MRQITIVEPAKAGYKTLSGQAKTIFNRTILNLARLKIYQVKNEIINLCIGPNGRKRMHYNDHKYFEIAFSIEPDGEMVVADFKCLF